MIVTEGFTGVHPSTTDTDLFSKLSGSLLLTAVNSSNLGKHFVRLNIRRSITSHSSEILVIIILDADTLIEAWDLWTSRR